MTKKKKEVKKTLKDVLGIRSMALTSDQFKGLLDAANLTLFGVKDRAMLEDKWSPELAKNIQDLYSFFLTVLEVYSSTVKLAVINNEINSKISSRIKQENGKNKIVKRK